MKLKKYIRNKAVLFLLPLLLVAGCDLIDPTQVHNPSITDKNLFEDASGGAEPLLVGLEYAYSNAAMRTAIYTDLVSDNYMNTSTYLSTIVDNPRLIAPTEMMLSDVDEIYFRLQNLNALANFGLSTVLPSDNLATHPQIARVHFYKGMALLMMSENFAAFPIVENGLMVKSEDAVKMAIESFNTSYQLDPGGNNGVNCKLALARAYRFAGDKVNAAAAANEAVGMSANYVLFARFDVSHLINDVWTFTISRTDDDMQPLPRLDFLDPKSLTKDAQLPTLKSEEAYLILAEAALANGDNTEAKAQMINAVNLADSRDVVQFTDNDRRRNRPNSDTEKVKADASAPAMNDLVYKRSGSNVNVHVVSGTSLTPDFINSLSSAEDIYYNLYLLRQQIFFLEGRRMSDLGIKLPVMQREIEANPNINAGDYGTYIIVPAYIPAEEGMDSFTMDGSGTTTIAYDMNKIIVQNLSSVAPFLK